MGSGKLHEGGDDYIGGHGKEKKVSKGIIWVLKAACGLEFFFWEEMV